MTGIKSDGVVHHWLLDVRYLVQVGPFVLFSSSSYLARVLTITLE
jgi:hypothetical protein